VVAGSVVAGAGTVAGTAVAAAGAAVAAAVASGVGATVGTAVAGTSVAASAVAVGSTTGVGSGSASAAVVGLVGTAPRSDGGIASGGVVAMGPSALAVICEPSLLDAQLTKSKSAASAVARKPGKLWGIRITAKPYPFITQPPSRRV